MDIETKREGVWKEGQRRGERETRIYRNTVTVAPCTSIDLFCSEYKMPFLSSASDDDLALV